MELGNIDKLNEDEILEDSEKIIALPKELEGAPDEIKDYYIKWIQCGLETKRSKRRNFTFISSQSGGIEVVDAMGIPGQAVKRAVQKGIGALDLKRLKALCIEMEETKKHKMRLKLEWLKWVRANYGNSVFDWRRAEILEIYSKFGTHEEVKQRLSQWGYETATDQLYKFFLKNKDVIERLRSEWVASSKDHYLATDSGRMETLAMLHAKFVDLFNISAQVINPNRDELRALSREIRGIIEQARKEVKGDQILLTIDGKIDINASQQATQTIQEISRKIPINMIPVYMVAAKIGMNPNNLITSLVNSFYKDFNGFRQLNNSGQPPSTMDLIRNYDWNEIGQYQANKPENQDESITDYEDIPFKEAELIKTKREKLLEMINKELKDK